MKFKETGEGDEAYESFTVVEVTEADLGAPGDRMKAFAAKFGALKGVDEQGLTTLAEDVASRYSGGGAG